MNELRKQWVDALRSGKYEQRVGCLRTIDDKYCSLGVVCDVYGVEWQKDRPINGAITRYGLKQTGDDGPMASLNCSGLPPDLEKKLGVDSDKFIELNDDLEQTFETIADYIESLPEAASV